LIALPAILLVPKVTRKDRLRMFGVMTAVTIVVVGPWVVRNLTTFERPTLLGSGFGWVLLYGSCDTTFYGPKVGYWDDSCALKDYPPDLEESILDQRSRTKALDYLDNHKGRLPVVVAARIGRVWELYAPAQNVDLDAVGERRGRAASWAVLIAYYLLMPFAIGGLVIMRRRKIPIFPFIAIAASITITVASSFAITRYRAPFDVVMPVLAAVAIDAVLRRRSSPAVDETRSVEPEPAVETPAQLPVAPVAR
jgi:hypothetical protein